MIHSALNELSARACHVSFQPCGPAAAVVVNMHAHSTHCAVHSLAPPTYPQSFKQPSAKPREPSVFDALNVQLMLLLTAATAAPYQEARSRTLYTWTHTFTLTTTQCGYKRYPGSQNIGNTLAMQLESVHCLLLPPQVIMACSPPAARFAVRLQITADQTQLLNQMPLPFVPITTFPKTSIDESIATGALPTVTF